MSPEEYLLYVDEQIQWHNNKSALNKTWHLSLEITKLLLAVAIPVLAGLVPSYPSLAAVTAALGAVVAALVGASNVCKFHENWLNYRCISESLKKEKMLYLNTAGPYSGACGVASFVERCEDVLDRGTKGWSQYHSPK